MLESNPKTIQDYKELYPELIPKRSGFSKTFYKQDGSRILIATQHPLHYQDSNNNFQDIDCSIENGKVEKTVYTAILLTDVIGYSIVCDEDSSRIDVKLDKIGSKIINYVEPIIEDNKAIWYEIDTDVDFIIEFTPTRVRCWKRLKTAQAAKDITFTVIEDDNKKKLRVIEKIVGYDNSGKRTKQRIDKGEESKYKTEDTQKDVKEYEVKQTFEDKVVIRNPETRVKEFSDDVSYPVMIDADVNVTISNSADDGVDRKVGIDGFTTDNNYNRNIFYEGEYDSAWQKFTGITIDQNSTISSAVLTLYMMANYIASEQTGVTETTLNIHAVNANDPTVNGQGDIVNLTVGQRVGTAVMSGVDIQSELFNKNLFNSEGANVKDIVQTLVNSYDYNNESMVFFGRKNIDTSNQDPSGTYANAGIFVYDREWGTTKAPRLVIVYTPAIHTTLKQYVDTDVASGGTGTIGDPYASLSEWHTAAGLDSLKNLVNDNRNFIVYCKGSVADTTSVIITGWTTDVTNNLTITTYGNGIHDGTAGTGYVLYPSVTSGIEVQNNNVTVAGIEVYDSDSSVNVLIFISGTSTNVVVRNNILHGRKGFQPNLGIYHISSGTNYIYNNIIYDISVAGGGPAGIRVHNGTAYVYNNTIANVGTDGIKWITGTLIAKNNIATDCDNDCFVGTFDGASDYNASGDGTAPGDNSRTNQTFTFVGAPDYHLDTTDTGALGQGISLRDDINLSFEIDIDGDERGDNNPSIGIWDIGADEFVPTYGFLGRMTDVRIFNKGLTQAEALALYQTNASLDNRGNLWC